MSELAIVACIPARYSSSRLPGKPLVDINGKPMIQHVYERVRAAKTPQRVLIATDDERILSAARTFGAEACLTSQDHASGTDRIAEAVESIPADVIVNVQGDEPLLDPAWIDLAVEALCRDASVDIATLCVPIRDAAEMLAPSVVKVVRDHAGNALYFSRSPIPHVRGAAAQEPRALAEAALALGLAKKHIGLYVYRRAALLRMTSLPPAPLETAEQLEQLRALAHGLRMRVVETTETDGCAVDTPEDLDRVRRILSALQQPG